MKHIASFSGVLLAAGLFHATTLAAIELGDPAPPLSIEQWAKGDPIDMAGGRGKSIYVVEFWATWCAPCRTSIPHLTALQKQFKDNQVVIIGVTDEKPATVKPFVTKLGDDMDYTVAIDAKGKTSKDYMGAFGVNGIPHAFVVDRDGKLAWHGHPMAGLDKVLKQLVEGTFDLAASKKAAAAERSLPEYFEKVGSSTPDPEAAKLGRQILEDAGDNADMLNQFAWIILTHRQIKSRDRDLAMQAAKKAYDLTDGKDAAIVDTYARALFDTGKTKEAIELQQQAIKVCTDPDLRAGLEDTLDRYRAATAKK